LGVGKAGGAGQQEQGKFRLGVHGDLLVGGVQTGPITGSPEWASA
jgi:hypothetical protein